MKLSRDSLHQPNHQDNRQGSQRDSLQKIAAPAKDTITAAPTTGRIAAGRHFVVATAAAAVGHATRPATTSVVRGI